MATITGIVRRSTSDSSSFQILPRSSADVRLGPALAAKGVVAAFKRSWGRHGQRRLGPSSRRRVPLSELGSLRRSPSLRCRSRNQRRRRRGDHRGRHRPSPHRRKRGVGSNRDARAGRRGRSDRARCRGRIRSPRHRRSGVDPGAAEPAGPGGRLLLPSLGWISAIAAASPSAGAAADEARRASSTEHPTDLATLLGVVVLATLLAVGASWRFVRYGVDRPAHRPPWRRRSAEARASE